MARSALECKDGFELLFCASKPITCITHSHTDTGTFKGSRVNIIYVYFFLFEMTNYVLQTGDFIHLLK